MMRSKEGEYGKKCELKSIEVENGKNGKETATDRRRMRTTETRAR